jgi:hypothetical protein
VSLATIPETSCEATHLDHYLVFDNRFSLITPKAVQVNATVNYMGRSGGIAWPLLHVDLLFSLDCFRD